MRRLQGNPKIAVWYDSAVFLVSDDSNEYMSIDFSDADLGSIYIIAANDLGARIVYEINSDDAQRIGRLFESYLRK